MSTEHPRIQLNDTIVMPQFGLGVWQASDSEATVAVREAIAAGYLAIDTAAIYKNEAAVGEGVRQAGKPRDQVFITTKVWNDDQGYDTAIKALQSSLKRLRMDYVDLLLIHWAQPAKDLYLETWQALIELKKRGLTRSIGVSNFHAPHLRRIIDETGETPSVNQIELHPYLQQHPLREVHQQLGIHTEAWSPLAQGKAMDDPVLKQIAAKHGKDVAQVIIRWHLDSGLIVIPKSVTPSRIRSNAQVFDFRLDAEEMAAIAELDRGQRLGPNPDTY
ncbi:aldo/keto reductase [Pseudomonas typographi]|uniref:Aldo/keto reductase n=1 Tax=Pseudomonas typographi TaxID=2715964 RepID=A0ABR7Z566_9PSED|nr:aldo/keto reductase [Pseudomonas typographi]MBD1553065.1 aldo/keto reductase [Pseudomonas typographi]MBD1588408.1 aldo/keto reductase [Pseudomonas typographi]MBD1600517.1 aldo/keto reductase [Pseudomonas typographi]